MFAYAVRRALRKSKTLRYGVPMLVSAGRVKCVLEAGGEEGFRKGGTSRLAGTRVR